MTQGIVDLHLHSLASDGRLGPGELVRHAHRCGVRLMALTDHDTTDGLAAAAATAQEIGMAFVPGIELSADWRGRTVHVLGFGIDAGQPGLRAGIERLGVERERRAGEIAARLDAAGAPGSEALAHIRASAPMVTRTHFARRLAELGAVRSLADAFDRYLGRGRPAAVRSDWPQVAEAVAWIVAAGGIAALAHPMRYTLSAGARRELCGAFRDAGGRAIEVVCGSGSAAHMQQATRLAQRYGLDGSVGSDFHDPAVPWNPPGRLAKLPASVRPVWADAAFPAGFN